MTANEILELRKQGQTEQAYEAARQLYSTDKGKLAASAMFWTAVDMLRQRSNEGNTNEANRILLALERLCPNVPDPDGWVACTLQQCQRLMGGQDAISEHTQIGRWGEEVAERYLFGQGYDIIEQDWRSGHRDIDIIARRGNLFVFVEVKTRRNREFGDPLDAIDFQKRYNLRCAITHYVRYHHIDHFRFDIITVVGMLGTPSPEITHIEDVNIMELENRHHRKRRY